MSEALGLGKIITTEQHRDAIHIAVAPVTAAEVLKPGQHVALLESGEAVAEGKTVGVVDPYLTRPALKGDRFWLFLYPGTITALRHEWAHPAFGAEIVTPALASRRWIEAFAAELDQTYNRLMEAAEHWLDGERYRERMEKEQPDARFGHWNDHYTYDNSERYKDVDAAKWPEFWRHYGVITGEDVSTLIASDNVHFFTCSC